MPSPRKTPTPPPAEPAATPITLVGAYTGPNPFAIVVSPNNFQALLGLGLDGEPFELPDDPAAAAKAVDEWVEWAIATYPELANENEALQARNQTLTNNADALELNLKGRKKEVKTLLKLLIRAEDRAEELENEQEEETLLTVNDKIGAALTRATEIVEGPYFPILYNSLPTSWQKFFRDYAGAVGLELDTIHAGVLVAAEGLPQAEETAQEEVPVMVAPTLEQSAPAAAEEPALTEEPAATVDEPAQPEAPETAAAPVVSFTLPLVDDTAKELHELWATRQRAAGQTTVFGQNNENLMVPYDNLSETVQAGYHAQVEAVYAAISAAQAAPSPAEVDQEPVAVPEASSAPENDTAEATQ